MPFFPHTTKLQIQHCYLLGIDLQKQIYFNDFLSDVCTVLTMEFYFPFWKVSLYWLFESNVPIPSFLRKWNSSDSSKRQSWTNTSLSFIPWNMIWVHLWSKCSSFFIPSFSIKQKMYSKNGIKFEKPDKITLM